MESKSAVYAVLAVAIGYLLISVVPNRLEDLGGGKPPIRAPAEEAFGLGDEESKSIESAEEGLRIESAEPRFSTGGVWGGAYALGLWVVNLLIALGAYLVVKRRLA